MWFPDVFAAVCLLRMLSGPSKAGGDRGGDQEEQLRAGAAAAAPAETAAWGRVWGVGAPHQLKVLEAVYACWCAVMRIECCVWVSIEVPVKCMVICMVRCTGKCQKAVAMLYSIMGVPKVYVV